MFFFNLAPGAASFALALAWGAAGGLGLAAAWWWCWGCAPLLVLCAWGPGTELSPRPQPHWCAPGASHGASTAWRVSVLFLYRFFFFIGVFVTLPNVRNDAADLPVFGRGLGLRPAVTSRVLLGAPLGAWSWVGADEMSSAHPPRCLCAFWLMRIELLETVYFIQFPIPPLTPSLCPLSSSSRAPPGLGGTAGAG